MGMAQAALHWSAEQYWASTPHEFWAAIEAWEKMNCVKEER